MSQRQGTHPTFSQNDARAPSNPQSSKKPLRLTLDQLQNLQVNLPPTFRNTGFSLVVCFGPAGTQVGLAENPPKLKSIDDVKRLFSARKQITSVESAEKRESMETQAKVSILRMERALPMKKGDDNSSLEIKSVPPQYASEMVKAKTIDRLLVANLDALNSNSNVEAESKMVKAFFNRQAQLIRLSFEQHLEKMVVQGKSSFDEILFKNGVTKAVYAKLCNQKLQIQANTNLIRLLFPSNGDKALRLTLAEWRNDQILREYDEILVHSSHLAASLNDKDFVKMAISLDGEIDEANPLWKRAEKLTIPVVPFGDWKTNLAVVNNFPVQRMIGDQLQYIESYGLSFTMLYYLVPPMGAKLETFYKVLDPEFSYKKDSIKKARDQFIASLTTDKVAKIQALFAVDPKGTYLAPKTAIMKMIVPVPEPLIDLVQTGLAVDVPRAFGAVPLKGLSSEPYQLTDPTALEVEAIRTSKDPFVLSIKSEQKKTKKRLASSMLTNAAKQVLAMASESKELKGLVDDIRSYLQSFDHEAFQVAAAKSIAAQIEAHDFEPEYLLPQEEEGISDTE